MPVTQPRSNKEVVSMLAAAPEQSGALELLRLALKLVSSQHVAEVSPHYRAYFARVLREAKQLSKAPESIDSDILPESIELALRMQTYNTLSSELDNVTDLDTVSPELAGKLLHDMESNTVYADQFALAT